ncbi:MAG: penicillin-binding protein 1C [Bacteroidota bacterium]
MWYVFCLPRPLFEDPTSTVLESHDGHLLGARIAEDGQWRFPYNAEVPEKFAIAITEFEDHRFYFHPGVDPVGIGRAVIQNIRNRKIVSGGSTLTMQVIRLSRKGKKRTVFQKTLEAIKATRLELGYSKKEILAFYASNAPFGGNVVGLDAAAWRYYGKSPALLSWAEAATLAVLPNSPSLIHPGRNRAALLAKRNRLLDRLHENGTIDDFGLELAKEEPLPSKPLPLPRKAPHLLERVHIENFSGKQNNRTRIKSTIDKNLQENANRIAKKHHRYLSSNGINNMAILTLDVETGNVLTYVGNVVDQPNNEHGHEVDIITSPRSTGSIIKPFLYALMINEGELLPSNIVSDIPTQMKGYKPENFWQTYDGAVTAKKSLARSLNVPAVRSLQKYGLEKFHFELQQLGFSTINKSASHYGLPLVLGGAEITLWDVTNAYACMARTLNHFIPYSSRYDPHDFRPPNYHASTEPPKTASDKRLKESSRLSASAIWETFNAMQEVERPSSEGSWKIYESSKKVAWKTGTSFGFRDAWAVGVTPEFVIGVWVGNADGEGRPGLVGVNAAAPVLFDMVKALPPTNWFDQPYDEFTESEICVRSGYRRMHACDSVISALIPVAGLNSRNCPYHQVIHLDQGQKFQVHGECERPSEMVHKSWFVLPPVEEHYFKLKNPDYVPLPPFREDCIDQAIVSSSKPMQLIYPKSPTTIFIPRDLDGEQSRTVFRAAHRQSETTIYWHIDNEFIGSTTDFHEMEFNPEPGKHQLTLIDRDGFRLEQEFEILSE